MSRRGIRNRQMTYRRRYSEPMIDADSFRRGVLVFLGLMFLIGVYFAWATLEDPDTLPFHHIKLVTSAHHLDVTALQNVVAGNLEGGFFSLDSQKLRDAVLEMSWVEDVSLRIVWPDVLEVDVIEQQPLARWNANELINAAGNIFQPSRETFPEQLPLFQGADEDLDPLLSNFQSFSKSLSSIGLTVQALRVDSRHAWNVVLSNGVHVIVGREDVDRRFSRFIRLYPSLIGAHADQVSTVDLRYPNGFTVGWKHKPKWLRAKA